MAGLRLRAQVLRWRRVRDGGMFWTLVLAVAVAGSRVTLTNGDSTQNASEGWMAHLRRRLMQNNYDYEPSSDEPGLLPGLLDEGEGPPPPPREAPGPADDEPREDAASLDNNEIDDEPTTVDSLYVPTFRNYPPDLEPPSEMKENTGRRLSRLSALANVSRDTRRSGAARQDLLYYVDDAWLRRDDDDDDDDDRRAARDDNELSSGDSDLSDGRRAFYTTTKTYKLIKLPGSARRDGLGPRFVEERSAQGVALMSLDGAPFPPFRLPRERRQYQAAEQD